MDTQKFRGKLQEAVDSINHLLASGESGENNSSTSTETATHSPSSTPVTANVNQLFQSYARDGRNRDEFIQMGSASTSSSSSTSRSGVNPMEVIPLIRKTFGPGSDSRRVSAKRTIKLKEDRPKKITPVTVKLFVLGDVGENLFPDEDRESQLTERGLGQTCGFPGQSASKEEFYNVIRSQIISRGKNEIQDLLESVRWTFLVCHSRKKLRGGEKLTAYELPTVKEFLATNFKVLFARPDSVVVPLHNTSSSDVDDNPTAIATPSSESLTVFSDEDFTLSDDDTFSSFVTISPEIKTLEEYRAQAHLGSPQKLNIVADRKYGEYLDPGHILSVYVDTELDLRSPTDVSFINERGLDTGGLSNEYFSLAALSLMKVPLDGKFLFEGKDNFKLPTPTSDFGDKFTLVGKFIIHSTIQTFIGLTGINNVVTKYIFAKDISHDSLLKWTISDESLPCVESQLVLQNLRALLNGTVNSEDEDKVYQETIHAMSECGFDGYLPRGNWSLKVIENLITEFKVFVVITSRYVPLKQIRDAIRRDDLFTFLLQRNDLRKHMFPSYNEFETSYQDVLNAFTNREDPKHELGFIGLSEWFFRLSQSAEPSTRRFVQFMTGSPVLFSNTLRFSTVLSSLETDKIIDGIRSRNNHISSSTCLRTLYVPTCLGVDEFCLQLDRALDLFQLTGFTHG